MTLLKKFDDNGQEIGSEDVFANANNFEQLLQQHGKDWAIGFKDCLSQILQQIDQQIRTSKYDSRMLNSDQVMGRRAEDFYFEKSQLIKSIYSILDSHSQANNSDSGQKYIT